MSQRRGYYARQARIKQALKDKGWTQRDLAEALGVHEVVVSQAINQDRRMSLERALEWASALDIKLNYVINMSKTKIDETVISDS